MKRIVVASENPVKSRATLRAFRRMFDREDFEVRGTSVPSGVGDQPRSDADTLKGAYNRVRAAAQRQPEADFWVGIEGGIEDSVEGMAAFAWVVVMSAGADAVGKGRTGTFFLPETVAQLVRDGMELGDADDVMFGRTNSKQKAGAIGILTGNVIDRTALYEHAIVLALVPFKDGL
jgi:inosine/xanthosine triphosphatase